MTITYSPLLKGYIAQIHRQPTNTHELPRLSMLAVDKDRAIVIAKALSRLLKN